MWRKELQNNITTIAELDDFQDLSKIEKIKLKKVIERHPMSISQFYASLIDWKDPKDPLKKMIVPTCDELKLSGSYDTSGEKSNTKFFGFQHKYEQTALVLATNQCASYCRFCFRKRMVGKHTQEVIQNFKHAVDYIQAHAEINNVLITGGDPLTLSTEILQTFLEDLEDISHLDFIRFGTKVPVFLPDRIIEDPDLIELISDYNRYKKQIYFVLQIDHPREITLELKKAVDILKRAGVILNNQTVLLKGVNDRPEVLAKLQNTLVSIGINPYYVFQCRPVKRVKRQYQITLEEGLHIVQKAKTFLNGHSKRFKYVMSHRTGKIEILGIEDNNIYFKYHQAKKSRNFNRFFHKKLDKKACWLDDLA